MESFLGDEELARFAGTTSGRHLVKTTQDLPTENLGRVGGTSKSNVTTEDRHPGRRSKGPDLVGLRRPTFCRSQVVSDDDGKRQ